MAQNVLEIDADRGRVGTQVHQRTARAALGLGEHAVGKGQRGEVHLDDIDIGRLEALVQVLVERLALQDVQEVAFNVAALHTDGVELQLRIDLVLLHGGIENLLVGVSHAAVVVHQLDDHALCDLRLVGQVFGDHVAHGTDRLAAHTDIHLCDLGLQLLLKLVDDVAQTLGGLVDVIDHTLADERRRVFLDVG